MSTPSSVYNDSITDTCSGEIRQGNVTLQATDGNETSGGYIEVYFVAGDTYIIQEELDDNSTNPSTSNNKLDSLDVTATELDEVSPPPRFYRGISSNKDHQKQTKL